jgi:hypothetical protein
MDNNILQQIDSALKEYEKIREELGRADAPRGELFRVYMRIASALDRLSPPNSVYRKADAGTLSERIRSAAGRLSALREEYALGYLKTFQELVHADMFSDFLDMAYYLNEQNYKDPAAVIAGSSLEQHLRELAKKDGTINLVDAKGKPIRAEVINQELCKNAIYNLLEQKNVTSWLHLRNKAAHGKYNEYNAGQVQLLIFSIREFMVRHPA